MAKVKTAQQRIREIKESAPEPVTVLTKNVQDAIEVEQFAEAQKPLLPTITKAVNHITPENQMEFMLPPSDFSVGDVNAGYWDAHFSGNMARMLGVENYQGVSKMFGSFFGCQSLKEVLCKYDQGQIMSRLYVLVLINAVSFGQTNEGLGFLMKENKTLQGMLEEAQELVNKLQTELQALKEAQPNTSVQEVQATVQKYAEEAAVAKKTAEILKARVTELEENHVHNVDFVETLQKSQARFEILYEEAKNENQILRDQQKDLSDALVKQDQELRESYEAELNKFQEDIAKREEDYLTLKAMLEAQLEVLRKENETLKESQTVTEAESANTEVKTESKAEEAKVDSTTNHEMKGQDIMDATIELKNVNSEAAMVANEAMKEFLKNSANVKELKAHSTNVTFGDVALYTAAGVGVAAVSYVAYNLIKEHFFNEE